MTNKIMKQFAIIASQEDFDSIEQLLIDWKKANNKGFYNVGTDGGWLGFQYYEIKDKPEQIIIKESPPASHKSWNEYYQDISALRYSDEAEYFYVNDKKVTREFILEQIRLENETK